MNKSPIPQGKYQPATRLGNTIYTAGMTPRENGVLKYTGRIRRNSMIEIYKDAIELAVNNALTAVLSVLAETEQIRQVATLTMYIACDEGFENHSKLADFASSFLYDSLGEKGIGSRTTVGVYSLPKDAPVEISLVVEVEKKVV